MAIDNAKAIIKAAKKGDAETMLRLLNEDPSLVMARDKDGSTPLHCAAWNGHEEVAAVRLDAGAEVNDHNQTATGARRLSMRPLMEIGSRSRRCSSREAPTSRPATSTAGRRWRRPAFTTPGRLRGS